MIDTNNFKTTRIVNDIYEEEISAETAYAFISPVHINELEIKDKGFYVPIPGQKLHFLKGCNVPRVKAKEFVDDNKLTIQRDMTKSDVLFYGQNTTSQYFDVISHYHSMPKTDYLKWLTVVYEGDLLNDEIIATLATESDFVLLNRIEQEFRGDRHIVWLNDTVSVNNPNDIEKQTNVIMLSDEENDEKLSIIKLFKTGVISLDNCYSQDNILDNINKTVMDDELYNQVRELCLSEDQANLVVGIEIMANCKFKESAVYLLLLMKEFENKIDNCRTSGHVNFKAFKDYFDLDNKDFSTIDSVVEILFEKKLLTKTNIERLKEHSIKEYNSKAQDYFRVANVVSVIDEGIITQEPDEDLFEKNEEEQQLLDK